MHGVICRMAKFAEPAMIDHSGQRVFLMGDKDFWKVDRPSEVVKDLCKRVFEEPDIYCSEKDQTKEEEREWHIVHLEDIAGRLHEGEHYEEAWHEPLDDHAH